VETAQGGTLFLDDVESCPSPLQAKLLRFVEEKRFTPVGSTVEKSADVRIISASNQGLKERSLTGRFREDLYYRLADVTIQLPPLRETPEAIIPLSLKFLHETCDELGRDLPQLTDEARELLGTMAWPGNVRQLKSVIRRVALSSSTEVTAVEIALAVNEGLSPPLLQTGSSLCTSPPPFPCGMDALERWALEQALHFCGGKRMKTAAMLGMNYYTFRRRLEKHGITVGEE
jgi:DNA-binding NtrC family response regulator